jgi:hypothetical protein
MWETWEHRPEELDLPAARHLGLAVLGTNERHGALRTLAYTGHIALKLLYELGVEGLGARLVLLGRGPLADESAALLQAAGAHVTAVAPAALDSARARAALASADALVVLENTTREVLLGPGGRIAAPALAAMNPALAVAHIAGNADRASLVAAGLRCAPERFAPAPHLSVPTDFLGPRPVIDLHTAGLAVGAALARARRAGLDAPRAEAHALAAVPFAQPFVPGVPPRALCLTLDVDWEPDFAIDAVAARLAARGVRATFFATHDSPALARLRARPDRFELGVHPNFLPGSTHGATPEAVLAHCMALVPEARAVRAHCLVQSTPLLDLILAATPLRVEASLFLPGAAPARPFAHRRAEDALVRVPYTWEDTFALAGRHALAPPLDDAPLVLAFHPIHIALNSTNMARYGALKRQVPALQDATAAQLAPFVAEGHGVGAVFDEALGVIAQHGGGLHVSEYAARERAWA